MSPVLSVLTPFRSPSGFPTVSPITRNLLKRNQTLPPAKARELSRAYAIAFCTPGADKSKGLEAFNALKNAAK